MLIGSTQVLQGHCPLVITEANEMKFDNLHARTQEEAQVREEREGARGRHDQRHRQSQEEQEDGGNIERRCLR